MNEKEYSDPIKVLKLKRDLLLSMFGIMEKNNDLINQDRIDEFQIQTQKTQEIIQKVDELNLLLAKMSQQQKDSLSGQNAVGLKNDIKDILKKIINMNKKNNAVAKEKVESYKNQIKNLNQTKKGMAYAKDKSHNAVFVDAKK